MEIFILLFVLSAIIVFIKEYIKDRRTPSEPTQEPEVTKEHTHIVSAELKPKKKGGIIGLFGVLLTAAWWFFLVYFASEKDPTLADAIRSGYVTNPINLTAIAALVSFFGLIFHDASCILLGAIALVGAVLVDYSVFFGLIPAILLMVSHARMKNSICLETTSMETK